MSNFFVVYQEFLVSLVLVNEYLLLPFSYYLTFFLYIINSKKFWTGSSMLFWFARSLF